MERRLKTYEDFIKEQLEADLSEAKRASLSQDLLVQIRFFQHERLVHLLVTTLFATLTFLCLLFHFIVPSLWLALLIFLLLILLVPYIRHYYVLENGVQRLYAYYDKLASV